jgi:hypothetical protein
MMDNKIARKSVVSHFNDTVRVYTDVGIFQVTPNPAHMINYTLCARGSRISVSIAPPLSDCVDVCEVLNVTGTETTIKINCGFDIDVYYGQNLPRKFFTSSIEVPITLTITVEANGLSYLNKVVYEDVEIDKIVDRVIVECTKHIMGA